MRELLPETDFRLFAVCVRFPQGLAGEVALTPVQPGVYEVRHFTGQLRVVVVHELPQQEHNALLHMFSVRPDLLRYGRAHYRVQSEETSTLLGQLFEKYQETTIMPKLLEQDDLFRKMSPEEVLKRLREETIDEIIKTMSAEEIVKRLSPDQLLATLAALAPLLPAQQRLQGLSPEEVLAALSPKQRAALAQRLKDSGSPSNPNASEPELGEGKP